MFMGQYQHSLDEKNRLIIPAKFRNELGSNFIITRGLENCLYVYDQKNWNLIVDKLNALPFTKKDARIFIRSFFSTATECELDKQGRVNIASRLITHAKLNKECVIIGANDRLEIWDKQAWEEFLNTNAQKLEDIAENLFMEVDL